MQDVKAVVREYLLNNFLMCSDVSIADDASFMNGHVLDSSGFMELVIFLEETFGVKIDDADLVPENLDSLINVEGFIARKRTVGRVA